MFVCFLRQPDCFSDGVEILDRGVGAVTVDDGCMHAACSVVVGQIVYRIRTLTGFWFVQKRIVLSVIVAVVCKKH